MNGRRGPSGETGPPLQDHCPSLKPKANRLSRSFRQNPRPSAVVVDSPKSQKSEFKTPTRIPRSRAAFSGESPHNDSDIQQDIIWDATSPSPRRLGKRGKKHAAGVVDISEIVNRIAPKHGRPKVVEPTLQQWIGDSAAIPCTPDVQVPKTKKKSPRSNGVDDLLKLAKQFDLNMFCQEEEEEEVEVDDMHQQSLELLSEDIMDLGNASRPGNRHSAANATAGMDEQPPLYQNIDDDLDFLFDGPTQHVSGELSQFSSAQPSQVKPAATVSSKEAPGKPLITNSKGTPATDEFEDDWENDDLLNDSLIMEMTQNPQNFTVPMYCSTQKPPGEIKHWASPVGAVLRRQSATSNVEKDNMRQRTTFKLQSNPNFSVEKIPTNFSSFLDYGSKAAEKTSQQSRVSSVETNSQRSSRDKSNSQKHQTRQRISSVKCSTSTSSASKTTRNFQEISSTAAAASLNAAPAVSHYLDDDLDSLFSSEPVWDDPADDDLLCEMCEDLENQFRGAENICIKPPVGQTSNQRPALQPSCRAWDNTRQKPANQLPASGHGGALVQPVSQRQTPTTLTWASGRPAGNFENSSGATNKSTCLQGSNRMQSTTAALQPPPGKPSKDQFTFKRPNNLVSTVTNTALSKCSAAEIELKKRQAMERRRQRLQTVQSN